MNMKLLKCGCNGMATHQNLHDEYKEPHPTCIVHNTCEVIEKPSLDNRLARCTYYGTEISSRRNECNQCRSICTHTEQSNVNLAFFQFKPTEEFDEFYCGCHSWD